MPVCTYDHKPLKQCTNVFGMHPSPCPSVWVGGPLLPREVQAGCGENWRTDEEAHRFFSVERRRRPMHPRLAADCWLSKGFCATAVPAELSTKFADIHRQAGSVVFIQETVEDRTCIYFGFVWPRAQHRPPCQPFDHPFNPPWKASDPLS
jgi:hypothetical protein